MPGRKPKATPSDALGLRQTPDPLAVLEFAGKIVEFSKENKNKKVIALFLGGKSVQKAKDLLKKEPNCHS